mgnify:CR=1 FL=1
MTNEQRAAWDREWISDVHQFLLLDVERMDEWVEFRKDQIARRERGIDMTKPEMVEIQPNVWIAK